MTPCERHDWKISKMSCTDIPAQCKSSALFCTSGVWPRATKYSPKALFHLPHLTAKADGSTAMSDAGTQEMFAWSHFGKFLRRDVMNLPGRTENYENWCKERSFKVHLVAICSILLTTDELLVPNLILRRGVPSMAALQEGKGHHSLKGKLLLALVLPNTTGSTIQSVTVSRDTHQGILCSAGQQTVFDISFIFVCVSFISFFLLPLLGMEWGRRSNLLKLASNFVVIQVRNKTTKLRLIR